MIQQLDNPHLSSTSRQLQQVPELLESYIVSDGGYAVAVHDVKYHESAARSPATVHLTDPSCRRRIMPGALSTMNRSASLGMCWRMVVKSHQKRFVNRDSLHQRMHAEVVRECHQAVLHLDTRCFEVVLNPGGGGVDLSRTNQSVQ